MSDVTTHRGRRARWVGLLALLAATACTAAEEPPPTVRVDRGLVSTSVSASGTLVAISEQNLGFPDGGRLADVLVKVGDRVTAGQVLARLDDFELRQALDQRQAQLDRQQAMLDKIRNSNAVEAAGATLDQAEAILSATEDQVDATASADSSATENARRQLDFDNDALDRARDQLANDESSCDSSGGSTTTTAPAAKPASGPLGGVGRTAGEAAGTNPACDRITSAKSAVRDAERTVLASENAVASAEAREETDAASGKLSIENARQSVVNAQNTIDSASSDRPADTDAQAASVRDAQAAVALAQRNVDNVELTAPVAGVVASINGTVGEFVGTASGTTAQSPGSNARLPGVAATTGSAGTGSGAFIVLSGVDSFQLVVPFEESDAARIAPNQPVEVSVDAIPDLTSPGTVLAVAPTGVEADGIVNYVTTIVLTASDPQLRDGQTAEAAVVVESVDGVLRVPSSTVRREDGRSVVSTPGPDGGEAVTTPFAPGRVGDEFTEVQSGLTEGQEVLVPQAQVVASPPPGGPPR